MLPNTLSPRQFLSLFYALEQDQEVKKKRQVAVLAQAVKYVYDKMSPA